MIRRTLLAVLGVWALSVDPGTWAAEDDKRIVNGPNRILFGGLELVLGQARRPRWRSSPTRAR